MSHARRGQLKEFNRHLLFHDRLYSNLAFLNVNRRGMNVIEALVDEIKSKWFIANIECIYAFEFVWIEYALFHIFFLLSSMDNAFYSFRCYNQVARDWLYLRDLFELNMLAVANIIWNWLVETWSTDQFWPPTGYYSHRYATFTWNESLKYNTYAPFFL